MSDRITKSTMSAVLVSALKLNIWDKNDSAIVFHDLTYLEQRIRNIIKTFPPNTLHAIAEKANPLPAILQFLKPFKVGAEAATLSEAYIAQKCGYGADKIIFDSPAKTVDELGYALKAGFHVNADSFDELKRIDAIHAKVSSKSNVGLRINPQVGEGKISITNVGGHYSRFGIPINEYENDLIDCYKKYPWLNGIHVHIGSQSSTLKQLVDATRRVLDFTERINKHFGYQRIRWFDLGGGLPVSYSDSEHAPSVSEYARQLKEKCPELIEKEYTIITEFGRHIHANTGWTASRVEYVKSYNNINTVVTHVGADLLMRRCYQPQFWFHEISVADKNGYIKNTTQTQKYNIVGPLCFAGDLIARDIELPVISEGDYLIIHDTGAYTVSMWLRHTSRQMPKVMGYTGMGDSFKILKEKESLDDVYNFWK